MSALAPIDPVMARALDLFDVPALDPAFADRAVAAAIGPRAPGWRTASGAGSTAAGRAAAAADRRGRWTRRAVVGAVGLGLASATAAAGGIFGPIPNPLPVVSQLIAPPPPPKLAKFARPERNKPPVAKSVAAPAPKAAPTGTPTGLDRVAALPQPVRQRLIARTVTAIQLRLRARGIDVPRWAIRARVIERIGAADQPLPPHFDRLLARIEARLASLPATPADAGIATVDGNSTRPLPSAELRQAWQERRARWRAWRLRRWLRGGEGARGGQAVAGPQVPSAGAVDAVPANPAPPPTGQFDQ